jgi:hypothetical protein
MPRLFFVRARQGALTLPPGGSRAFRKSLLARRLPKAAPRLYSLPVFSALRRMHNPNDLDERHEATRDTRHLVVACCVASIK